MTTEELEEINADLETARAEWHEANAKNRVNSTVEHVAWRRYSDAMKRYIAARRARANDEKVSEKQYHKDAFCDAWTALAANETPTVDDMMDYLGVCRRGVFRRIKEFGYKVENGKVVKA